MLAEDAVFPPMVVVGDKVFETGPEFADTIPFPEIDILILEGTPEPLDVNIVKHPADAVHADADILVFLQHAQKGFRGELTSLIGVEYLRLTVLPQGLFQRLDAEVAVERTAQPPTEDRSAVPVGDRHEIQETVRQANIPNFPPKNIHYKLTS